METAFKLADAWEDKYPVDHTLLAWASLFHDCAKEISREEERHLVETNHLEYGEELMNTPSLVHAPLGALLLQEKFGIDHPEVLKAVAYHPTGHPTLGPMGWMVYMSDYLEPGRTYFEERENILEDALKDPLLGLRRITNLRLSTVMELKKPLNPAVLVFKEHLDQVKSL